MANIANLITKLTGIIASLDDIRDAISQGGGGSSTASGVTVTPVAPLTGTNLQATTNETAALLQEHTDDISALNSSLTPQYGTFAVESSNYAVTHLLVMKQGKLCYFSVRLLNSGTWESQSSWQYLGTISEGFRPSAIVVRVMADDNTHDIPIVVDISPDGRVGMLVTPASSGMNNIIINVSYPVS